MPQQGLLPGSLVMLVFGIALLWGGLTFFITTALRAEKKKEHQHG
ncbi:MAG: MetS family NSS transporter small subunit [Symbiobacterium sp.]